MPDYEGFNQRAHWALKQLEARIGRDIEQTELGEMVGQVVGDGAFSQSTAGAWTNTKPGKGSLPRVPTIYGLAKVLGVDPGWLAFGSDSSAASPPGYVAPEITLGAPLGGASAAPSISPAAALDADVRRKHEHVKEAAKRADRAQTDQPPQPARRRSGQG